ncbi:hypothetical protein KVV02_003484 [Mortierella alpina]|uniref:WD40 repeat-like protein n=1 Tax=Mortierella alpina TaxID=64518 RepID=A0A9P8A5P7_MORAP|nr:hypothetical protein KVV02_003484 [Mortierella alpina]
MFDSLFQSWRSPLSPPQALKLAKFYLASAGSADEPAIALALCEQAEMLLDRIKRPKPSSATESETYQPFREEVAAAYSELARLMADEKYPEREQASRTKSEKWRGASSKNGVTVPNQLAIREDTPFPDGIFDTNDARPAPDPSSLPEINKPFNDTQQLAYWLAFLHTVETPDETLPQATRDWHQAVKEDEEERRRLEELVKSLVRAFTHDELKDADAVAEVTYVAPVLENPDFRFLLKLFVTSLKDSALLELASVYGNTHWRLQDVKTDAAFEIKTVARDNEKFWQTHSSPTGTKIALLGATSQPFISIWDVRSKSLVELEPFWRPCTMALAFSPGGDSIAMFGCPDGKVEIWNTETANLRFTLESNGEGLLLDAGFSPKGDLIVTGGTGLIVQLWDADTGMCRASMSGHSGIIRSVVFSPDGRHIASSGDDTRVRLWKVEAGTTRANSSNIGYTLLSIGQSSRGDSILSVDGGDTVRLWNMETGECPQSLTAEGPQARSIACSPCRGQIASGTSGGEIILWSLEKGVLSSVLGDHDEAVKSVAYSPKGNQIASGNGRAVKIWDTETGNCLRHYSRRDEDRGILAIAYSPKTDQFASVVKGSSIIRLWNVDTRICHTLHGRDSHIRSIMYSPTVDEIVSASRDYIVRLWDTSSGLCRLILEGREALYTPNGQEIASRCRGGAIRFWNVETGICRLVITPLLAGIGLEISLSLSGDIIACEGYRCAGQLWNATTEECLPLVQGDPNDVFDSYPKIIFSPRGDLMALYNGASSDSNGRWRVKLCDVATGECRREITGISEITIAPVFSPAGSRIACSKNDVMQDAETGVCLHTIQHYQSIGVLLAFSPNGDRIVCGSTEGFVKLWDTKSGTQIDCFGGHEGTVNCVVYSPNKPLLASGSDDTTIVLWNLEDASDWCLLEGHTASVLCVVFSACGNSIVSGSIDKTIRLWDVETKSCNRTMDGAGVEIWSLAYSPDGKLLASGTSEMSVYLWNVASGQSWAVIEGTYGNITSVAWGIGSDTDYLITGSSDTSSLVSHGWS